MSPFCSHNIRKKNITKSTIKKSIHQRNMTKEKDKMSTKIHANYLQQNTNTFPQKFKKLLNL